MNENILSEVIAAKATTKVRLARSAQWRAWAELKVAKKQVVVEKLVAASRQRRAEVDATSIRRSRRRTS